jgi:hypothetical protein
LAAGFVTASAILFDLFGRGYRQRMAVMDAVMDAVWPITALYFGPPAWWGYRRRGTAQQPEV